MTVMVGEGCSASSLLKPVHPLQPSQRLLDGLGLTWTGGAPVEGYSNLLWVLGCALLGAFSIDLIDAARRGYGVALHQGKALVDASTVSPGDSIHLRLDRGTLDATVTRVGT